MSKALLVVEAVVAAPAGDEPIAVDAAVWADIWAESEVVECCQGVVPVPPGFVLVVTARLEPEALHAERVAVARLRDPDAAPTGPWRVAHHPGPAPLEPPDA